MHDLPVPWMSFSCAGYTLKNLGQNTKKEGHPESATHSGALRGATPCSIARTGFYFLGFSESPQASNYPPGPNFFFSKSSHTSGGGYSNVGPLGTIWIYGFSRIIRAFLGTCLRIKHQRCGRVWGFEALGV